MVSEENKNKTIFLKKVVEEFMQKITGEKEDRVVGKNPDNKFFVGKLSTKDEKNDMNSSKTFINQMGVEFLIKKSELKNASLTIKPRGEFYYRVNPTLKEQRSSILDRYRLKEGKKELIYEDIIKKWTTDEKDDFGTKIVPVYEKVKMDEQFITKCDLNEIYNSKKDFGFKEVHNELTEKIDRIIENISNGKDVYKVNRNKIQISDTLDENSWNVYLNRSKTKVIPRWDVSICIEIKPYTDQINKISVYLVNETKFDGDERKEKKKNTKKQINMIFNAGLEIELDGAAYQPIELDYFSYDYKYDKKEMAIGHNCGIEWSENNKHVISTTNIPIFKQNRLKTRDDLVVKFDELINCPIDTLNSIYDKMMKESKEWKVDFEKRKNELADNFEDNKKAKELFEEEIKGFEFEIDRFKNGIEKIKCYDHIKEAFILMNKVFKKSAKGYDSWRLFQIVFIVSLIPDIGVSEYGEEQMGNKCKIDKVDLLYFPTGGGKTEAFLGITIFTLFFDRLRGKKMATSALIKYPLRLLSVQQVQRVADILATSELLRKEHKEIKDSEEFSLGYYVGDGNTPNNLNKERMNEILNETQEQLNEKYKIIDKCPFCGSLEINICLDKENLRLMHICNNANCSSGGILPLYIVDKEIYRYVPSIIISTIDKIAAIGYQSNFRNILGEVTHKCPVHGYTSKTKCIEDKFCDVDVSKFKVEIYDPAPTLLIQDELHLVRESLGAFDAHYETFYQYMIKNLTKSKKKIKIIGATATISSYKSQLYHLYGKEGERFPCASPYPNRNFYSYIDKDETHRFILGYAPYGKAIINSVVYSMKYLREVIWEYFDDHKKLLSIDGISITSKKEALDILKDYWILLEYNNVKLDGNKVLNALEDPINTELQTAGITPFEYRKMTGDDTFQDVRKILAEVENTKNVFEGFNTIAATSMISHGVDADKFNTMLFFGMPGNTAEYIQAYSRAGRKYPGLIIMLLRPTRVKDISYLKNFVKFHEYKDILVEPVPINRWATKAVDKTLPGILQGIILNYYDKNLQYEYGNLYMAKNFKEAIENNKINEKEIIDHILKAYQCINENSITVDLGNQYRIIIENKVKKVFDEIRSTTYSNKDFLSEALIKIEGLSGERVMTSLRDSDVQVKVRLD